MIKKKRPMQYYYNIIMLDDLILNQFIRIQNEITNRKIFVIDARVMRLDVKSITLVSIIYILCTAYYACVITLMVNIILLWTPVQQDPSTLYTSSNPLIRTYYLLYYVLITAIHGGGS